MRAGHVISRLAAIGLTVALTSSVAGAQTRQQYTLGWFVKLLTASVRDKKFVRDPGNVGAYIEPGPTFTQQALIKQSGLANSRQFIVGIASSKFVARSAGTYQLGLRIEMSKDPPFSICWQKLSLGDKSLVDRNVDNESSREGESNTVIVMTPVELAQGDYDTTLEIMCWKNNYAGFIDQGPSRTDVGKVTVLVTHPDELKPTAALPDDFVHPPTSLDSAPTPKAPQH